MQARSMACQKGGILAGNEFHDKRSRRRGFLIFHLRIKMGSKKEDKFPFLVSKFNVNALNVSPEKRFKNPIVLSHIPLPHHHHPWPWPGGRTHRPLATSTFLPVLMGKRMRYVLGRKGGRGKTSGT